MPPRKDRVGVTRIEQRRIAAGLTQRELARRADISLSTLQRIEQLDNDNPGVRYLANIASVLGCAIEDLIEESWREPMENRWGRG
jgi:transcriptional regulator with XRE-family HTH domain